MKKKTDIFWVEIVPLEAAVFEAFPTIVTLLIHYKNQNVSIMADHNNRPILCESVEKAMNKILDTCGKTVYKTSKEIMIKAAKMRTEMKKLRREETPVCIDQKILNLAVKEVLKCQA